MDEVDHQHASQEYYKIQIGTLIPLDHPIPAGKWRRITFFYTTGEYLNKAATINELVVHSDERRTLWNALRERASVSQEYTIEGDPVMEIDPLLLAEILGIKDINNFTN